MEIPVSKPRPATKRDLLFFSTPSLSTTWPVLPVVRHSDDGRWDCGVMIDFHNTSRRCGYSATVFLSNMFLLPKSEEELLKLPKETFDTVEEIAEAGWRVD